MSLPAAAKAAIAGATVMGDAATFTSMRLSAGHRTSNKGRQMQARMIPAGDRLTVRWSITGRTRPPRRSRRASAPPGRAAAACVHTEDQCSRRSITAARSAAGAGTPRRLRPAFARPAERRSRQWRPATMLRRRSALARAQKTLWKRSRRQATRPGSSGPRDTTAKRRRGGCTTADPVRSRSRPCQAGTSSVGGRRRT